MPLAYVIAIAIPLGFLGLVRWLDLYASGSFKAVLLCFGWGIAAFFLAYQINTSAYEYVGFLLVILFAPIIEEICKSLILIYVVRRSDFTYFVDGAIYGFAAGTAFAILENLLYLGYAEGAGVMVALSRALSTCLMHGSASALVGISLGRMRFSHGANRIWSLLLGWAGAIGLHLVYNNLINVGSGIGILLVAILMGLGGIGLIVAFILWGLREERGWLRETLGLQVGVSGAESSVVQNMDNLETLLAPVAQRFGEDKCKQVESFVKLQALIGLKLRARALTDDAALGTELDRQVTSLRNEMDQLRRAVGVYCMAYVRSIFPSQTEPLWERLGQAVAMREPSSGESLWNALGERITEKDH